MQGFFQSHRPRFHQDNPEKWFLKTSIQGTTDRKCIDTDAAAGFIQTHTVCIKRGGCRLEGYLQTPKGTLDKKDFVTFNPRWTTGLVWMLWIFFFFFNETERKDETKDFHWFIDRKLNMLIKGPFLSPSFIKKIIPTEIIIHGFRPVTCFSLVSSSYTSNMAANSKVPHVFRQKQTNKTSISQKGQGCDWYVQI